VEALEFTFVGLGRQAREFVRKVHKPLPELLTSSFYASPMSDPEQEVILRRDNCVGFFCQKAVRPDAEKQE
jgi:hypothetical protein